MVMTLVFLPLLVFDHTVADWSYWIWPLIGGVGFFLGQVFTVLAVRVGDVSVQTPLMGIKVLFVAAFSFMLDPAPIPIEAWLAAGLAAVVVFLISRSRNTDYPYVWCSWY